MAVASRRVGSRANTRERHPGGRFAGLDGLRGLAAIAVVTCHGTTGMGVTPHGSGGFIGVVVFFVLSGFLITLVVTKRDATAAEYRHFVCRRVQRLAPALLGLVLVLTPILLVLGEPERDVLKDGAFALTETTGFAQAAGVSILQPWQPTWSLTVEWTFYLLWPLGLMAAIRRGVAMDRLPRWAWMAASVLYLSGMFLSGRDFYLLPVANLGAMVAGAALALEHRRRRFVFARREQPDPAWGCGGTFLLVALSVLPGSGDTWAYRLVVFPAVVASALVVVDACATGTGVSAVLARRGLAAVGQRAYSLYLWHVPIFWLVWTNRPPWPAFAIWMIAVVAVIPVTWLSFRLLERPWLSRDGYAARSR